MLKWLKLKSQHCQLLMRTLFKAYGVEEGTVSKLSVRMLKTIWSRELKQVLRGKLKNAVMDALYEKFQLAVPNALIDEEIERSDETLYGICQKTKNKTGRFTSCLETHLKSKRNVV